MKDESEGVTLPEGWVIDDQEMEWDHHQPPWDGVSLMRPTLKPTGRFKLTIHGHRVEEPPRSEYPLQTVTTAAGCTVVNDTGVTLVSAHSLRTGDEVEWAAGDWRAIEVRAPTPPAASVHVDVAGGGDSHWFDSMALVAVRRAGVEG